MRAALAFLTIVGGAAAPDRRAPAWFAVVGGLVGLAVGGVWWVAGELWPPLVAGLLAVAADAVLTGMLHLDGLADSADGLLPPVDRGRRLAIMATPEVGAFGVTALVLVVGARAAALAAIAPDPVLVAGLWAGSRAAMALTMALVPYARDRGAASAFASPDRRPAAVPAAGGLLGASVLVVVTLGAGPGTATIAALLAGFAAVLALAVRRLGGYTGDVLGAAGVVAETVGLLAAAARW
jgi:adenosylcobinamide-GDP ribazoletransferase